MLDTLRDLLRSFFSWHPALLLGVSSWCVALCFSHPSGSLFEPSPVRLSGLLLYWMLLAAFCVYLLWHRRSWKEEEKVLFSSFLLSWLLIGAFATPKVYDIVHWPNLVPSTFQEKFVRKVFIKGVVRSRILTDLYGKPVWNLTVLPQQISDKDENWSHRLSYSLCDVPCRVKASQPCPFQIGDVFEGPASVSVDWDEQKQRWNLQLTPDWQRTTVTETESLRRWIGEGRLYMERVLYTTVAHLYANDPSARDILLSLIFGFPLERDVRFDIHRVGLDHLFAVSGFHFSLLAAFVVTFLGFIPVRWRTGCVLAVSAFFLFLIGPHAPSVLRAWWTICFSSVGVLLSRTTFPINSFGCALLIGTLLDPTSVFSMGFQLSYMATWGILIYSGPLGRLFSVSLFKKRDRRGIEMMGHFDRVAYLIVRLFSSAVSVSLSVWLFVVPYTFAFIGGFPPLGMVYNLLMPPLFSLVMFFGMVSLLFYPVNFFIASFFSRCATLLTGFGMSMIDVTKGLEIEPPFAVAAILQSELLFFILFALLGLCGVLWYTQVKKAHLKEVYEEDQPAAELSWQGYI